MSFVETDRELTRHSYYAATAPRTQAFAPLPAGEVACDVAVVGGGLAGLSAAIELRDRGFAVTLLEAQTIGHGASGRNGGQAIYGLACDITTIEDQLGRDAARQVFAMSLEALDLIRERIARFDIDCDWRDGYLGVAMNARKARALRDEVDLLAERYEHALTWVDAQRPAAVDRQPALCRRRARPALGPSASAEVHAGPGEGSGIAGRVAAREHARSPRSTTKRRVFA